MMRAFSASPLLTKRSESPGEGPGVRFPLPSPNEAKRESRRGAGGEVSPSLHQRVRLENREQDRENYEAYEAAH